VTAKRLGFDLRQANRDIALRQETLAAVVGFIATSATAYLVGRFFALTRPLSEKVESGFAGKQLCCFLIRSTSSESGLNF
jgi:hypothetical protein